MANTRHRQTIPLRDAAIFLGVRARSLYDYREQGMPIIEPEGPGIIHVHMPTVIDWIAERKARAMLKDHSAPVSNLVGDRARLMRAQADQRELVVRKMRRELIAKEDVASVIRQLFVLLRRAIMDLPGRKAAELALETDKKKVHHQLYIECRQTMSACADCVAEYCEDIADEIPETIDS